MELPNISGLPVGPLLWKKDGGGWTGGATVSWGGLAGRQEQNIEEKQGGGGVHEGAL